MKKRLLSIILALCMIVTMLPVITMAEETHTTIGTSGEIINFAPLTETEKTRALGTSIEDLELPETLTAVVRTVVPVEEDSVQDSSNPDEDTVTGNSGIATPTTATDPEWEETTVGIPVKWESTPEYDMDTEGEYVFTPVLKGYTVSAPLPEIKVTVERAIMARGAATLISATTYEIWVGGVQVTDSNKDGITGTGIEGTITFDPDTFTLTLDNAKISSAREDLWGDDRVNIHHDTFRGSLKLKLKLIGENEIIGVDAKKSTYGIKCEGDLTIDGEGSLTITPGKAYTEGGIGQNDSTGIFAREGLTINSGILDIGGEQNGLSGYYNGVITINGGTVTAYGTKNAIYTSPKEDLIINGRASVMVGDEAPGLEWGGTTSLSQEYKYVRIEVSKDVAEIDATGYLTLQEAFNVAKDGETIKLLKDINLTATITSSGNNNNFSLDLNGKTLNSDSNVAIDHSGTGTLTIKDSGTDGKITSRASQSLNGNSNGTIDLKDGILEVESGTIENTLNDKDANAILKDHEENGTIIIAGGTITSREGTAIYYGYLPYSSDLTIPSGILVPRGTAIIKGGLQAMSKAPDLNSYTNVKVTASTNYDGSDPVTYNRAYVYTYKYLKFEPEQIPNTLTGTATISNTSPRIGDTLTATLVDGNNTGTLTYIWKTNSMQVGTGESYTVAVADLGNVITLEIISDVETGTVTSITTAVAKKAAPSAPSAPILVSKTYNTVTLTANTAYEFSKDGTNWQTSPIFTGLTANTAHTFYQKVAETADTEASVASAGFSVTTNSNSSGDSGSSGDSSGDSGSSGTSSNSSHVIVTPPAVDKPNDPTQGEIKVHGIADGKGNITVNITNKTVTDAFDKALADAKKNGNEKNGITVVLRVDTSSKTGSNVTVNLPKTVQDTIIKKKIVNTIVVVDNPDIRIGMDLTTVQEINKQAKSDVNITATRTDSSKLTVDAKKAIGSRPVFDLKVNYSSGKQVQSFGAGSVSVTIPYTLGANEKAENVQAVYVDDDGKVHWLTNSVYDSVAQVLRFATDHFSTYGIGYKQINTAFTDITGHWAKEDIEFVVNRGLFSGTSATTFSPNTAVTRGMFVTALGRLANADVSGYANSNFTDVKSDAYYMGYIEWTSKNSIVKGTGNGRFAPDQSITREQMAVIMENYAKVIGFTMPKVHGENTFDDSTKISIYAKDAVNQMQMAGVISGKNDNLFDPQGTATRAEISAVLRRFVELVISSDNRMSKMQ